MPKLPESKPELSNEQAPLLVSSEENIINQSPVARSNVESFDALQWNAPSMAHIQSTILWLKTMESISRFWMFFPVLNASASLWTRCCQKKDIVTMRTDMISLWQQGVAVGFACGSTGYFCVLALSSPIRFHRLWDTIPRSAGWAFQRQNSWAFLWMKVF